MRNWRGNFGGWAGAAVVDWLMADTAFSDCGHDGKTWAWDGVDVKNEDGVSL